MQQLPNHNSHEMNQTQINDFLKCLMNINDLNYLFLHDQLRNEDGHDHHNVNHINDHEHDHSNSHDDLLVSKSTAMVVLFFASTLCGSMPFMLNRCFHWTSKQHTSSDRSAILVKSLLYFGGGVLMATTFLHLLPEVQEVVEHLQECGAISTFRFPLAEFLMCMGFYLMYLIEESIHAFIHVRNNRLTLNENNAAAAFRRGQSVRGSYLLRGSKHMSYVKDDDKNGKYQPNENLNNSMPNSSSNVSSLATLSAEDLVPTPKLSEEKLNASNEHHQQHNLHHHIHCHQHEDHEIDCRRHNHSYAVDHGHNHASDHNHGHSHLSSSLQSTTQDDVLTSSLRGLFIVMALSLHELFEGMAIGLEGSASSVWFLFGAVSAHKLVLAFCVGVELIVARTRLTLSIIYILSFAVVSPLGIGIGILVSHNSSGSSTDPSIASALLQGLACGTLLYVVFFEILSKQHNGLMTYFALLLGFGCMFGLQQLGADGHGHSHGVCSSTTNFMSKHEPSGTPIHSDHHIYEQQLQNLRKLSKNILKN